MLKGVKIHSSQIWLEKILSIVNHSSTFSVPVQNASPENKLRLLMIYASVYPEKFEDDKALKIMQVTERNLFYLKRFFIHRMLSISPSKKRSL